MDATRQDGLEEWMKSGRYLPPAMRDFHDQKDVFKAIHETTNISGHEYANSVDWVTGHCYVIDIFLWWMAKRGYTLQKSRANVTFRSLHDDVQGVRDLTMRRFMQCMGGTTPESPARSQNHNERSEGENKGETNEQMAAD